MAHRESRIEILKRVLSVPTAPFAEGHAVELVKAFCRARRAATVKQDAVGNLLVRIRRGKRPVARPVCLTAHLDHPGFVAERTDQQGRIVAVWRGGVRPEYFPGAGVRFFVDGVWVRGRIESVHCIGRGSNRVVQRVTAATPKPVPGGAIGMWDLPDPSVRGRRIFARACDDLAGAAAMLCCIDQINRSRRPVDAYFLFTRAEEVGFVGALAACRLGTIPKRCRVVAVENSSELPGARMGDGPILRVGDKATVFSPQATAFCGVVADRLAKSKKTFRYQRKLMDGGTCESSVYYHRGYDATGICIALGHYHNMDRKRGVIAPEYIHLDDFEHLVDWFVALCEPAGPGDDASVALDKRLGGLERKYRRLLDKTANQSA